MLTDKEKRLLIKQAAKLTALGVKVERERDTLRRLVARGVPYTDPQMLTALKRFRQAEAEWKHLEDEHLALREKWRGN